MAKFDLKYLLIILILLIGYALVHIILLGSKQLEIVEKLLKLIRTQPAHKLTPTSVRPGVIILGMHRSGTSLLSGLIVKVGFETGGPLVPAILKDNDKGYFERIGNDLFQTLGALFLFSYYTVIDVVEANDELLASQGLHYGYKAHAFDPTLAYQHILRSENVTIREGKKFGLEFLNNPQNYPWMLKDPRLSITLRAWLPSLSSYPAILFTYRHPYDLALSLHARGHNLTILYSLKLWYVYNRRAIEHSNDLCRIVSSHRDIMTAPDTELAYIADELQKCGVQVKHRLEPSEISEFIDVSLQHGKTAVTDSCCDSSPANDYKAVTPLPVGSWVDPPPSEADLSMYRAAIRLYCDMGTGAALARGYAFNQTIINT